MSAPQPDLPESAWRFGRVPFGPDDIVAEGADLEASTLVDAYSHGLFPMPIGRRRLGWFSPQERGIFPLDGFHVSRSLEKSCRRFRVTLDHDFVGVMRGCGDPHRDHGWINEEFVAAYSRLHRLGFAHSIEVWRDDELVGGVYGVRIRRFFAGESMFHRATDASKVALVALVDLLRAGGFSLFDVQWSTPHLASLGAISVPRPRYLETLSEAVNDPNGRQTESHG
ncbi:MAG: leucyl/phenylalanyl-tRNA--protein transferase [Acidimicrobiales bacterium mtb01]|nr:leucyl/phenylalanyl-tRNA--protein transferase [Actinomycetota bacterium]TEX46860.1 MAG: leucyl/phenylalanyl-tRNA--protein transferase [Acidimicrobiales bacterium mtb01]